jgi:DNA-binding MarR family transcriptional regulator
MSFAQMRILSLIARDPMRASELADGAALSRPTLSGLLDGLAAKGWIHRQAVEGDRRGVSLSITTTGLNALQTAHHHASEALTELFDEIDDPDERARCIEALGALAGVATRRLDRKLAAREAKP